MDNEYGDRNEQTRRSSSEGTDEDSEDVPLLHETEPKDSYNATFLIFYLLGMGTLLPWNFFISVNNFWDYKFRDINNTMNEDNDVLYDEEGKTELQKEFTSYLAIASNVPNALFVILNAMFGQRFQLKHRMFLSLAVVIALFFIVLVFAKANSDQWQHEFLDLILVLVVLINCFTAIFQGALFGVAGKFPPKYMVSCITYII